MAYSKNYNVTKSYNGYVLQSNGIHLSNRLASSSAVLAIAKNLGLKAYHFKVDKEIDVHSVIPKLRKINQQKYHYIHYCSPSRPHDIFIFTKDELPIIDSILNTNFSNYEFIQSYDINDNVDFYRLVGLVYGTCEYEFSGTLGQRLWRTSLLTQNEREQSVCYDLVIKDCNSGISSTIN